MIHMHSSQTTCRSDSIGIGNAMAPAGQFPARATCTASGPWALWGLLGTTRIRTAFGELPIGLLRANDPIITGAGRILQPRRIDRFTLDRGFLLRHPEAQPIRILAGTLGPDLPQHDILVSPGQEMVLPCQADPPQRLRAGEMVESHFAEAVRLGVVTYYTIEFCEPAFVHVEGVPALMPVRQAVVDEDDEDE